MREQCSTKAFKHRNWITDFYLAIIERLVSWDYCRDKGLFPYVKIADISVDFMTGRGDEIDPFFVNFIFVVFRFKKSNPVKGSNTINGVGHFADFLEKTERYQVSSIRRERHRQYRIALTAIAKVPTSNLPVLTSSAYKLQFYSLYDLVQSYACFSGYQEWSDYYANVNNPLEEALRCVFS